MEIEPPRYFDPPHLLSTDRQGKKIPWIGGSKTPWTVVEIWKGGQNTMGRGFKIPWIVGSKYNG
jgi:hypothetical protein